MTSEPQTTEWHHAPPHNFVPNATYFITAGTHWKQHRFDTPAKLGVLQSTIFTEFDRASWRLEAWAIFANHYHLVARAPENARTLKQLLANIHASSARRLNEFDGAPGRQVWFNYRDTCLTYQTSYLARLHYVHANPVKHGLVKNAEEYQWCSMSWFLREAEPGFRRTVLSFKTDKLSVPDDF